MAVERSKFVPMPGEELSEGLVTHWDQYGGCMEIVQGVEWFPFVPTLWAYRCREPLLVRLGHGYSFFYLLAFVRSTVMLPGTVLCY